jgi:hypothetical protein
MAGKGVRIWSVNVHASAYAWPSDRDVTTFIALHSDYISTCVTLGTRFGEILRASALVDW